MQYQFSIRDFITRKYNETITDDRENLMAGKLASRYTCILFTLLVVTVGILWVPFGILGVTIGIPANIGGATKG